MAKSLTPDTLSAINSATKNIDRLTKREVFILGTQGLLSMTDTGFELTSKATRAVKRAQKDAVAEVLGQDGWTDIRCHDDYAGLPRVTVARRA